MSSFLGGLRASRGLGLLGRVQGFFLGGGSGLQGAFVGVLGGFLCVWGFWGLGFGATGLWALGLFKRFSGSEGFFQV